MPAFSAASIIARPMRSLTLDSGLKNSSFTQHRGPARRNDAVQPDQRRVEGGFDDVGVGAVVGHRACS